MSISTFSFPTTIKFGVGARDLVAAHLLEVGVQRPLVVTDKGVGGLGMFTDFIANLAAAGLDPAPFDGVWGNPVKSQVTSGVEAYRNHEADAIVGVGGGAALDVAKAIALMATHEGDLFDYEDEMPGARPIDDSVPYFVALPTTAGTGSEVGRSAVISDDETHIKKIIFSPHLLAKVVFADPEMTKDLPGPITAATGMDALTHNIEAYLAKNYHPICDGIALEGIRLGQQHLANAVANPHDLDARAGMLMCSMMGAIAFQKGLGVVHSAAHALGTVADLHHGLANAIMIDHALELNVESVPERFATMAVTVGLDDDSPGAFLRWLGDLKREISVPASLAGTEVSRDDLPRLATVAFEDACHANNPRVVTHDDFTSLFTKVFD
jgi:alcohol dehydrogenase class IV